MNPPSVTDVLDSLVPGDARRSLLSDLPISVDLHHAVMDALTEGVMVQDRHGRVVSINPQAVELFGAGPRELAGDDGWELLDTAGRPLPDERRPARVALATGQPVLNEVLGLRQADGSTRWIEVSSHPVFGTGGPAPDLVVSSVRDVTDRRLAADQLHVKARLLNSVDQAVVAWDTFGTITFINEVAEELYGWPAGQAIGRWIGDVAPPDLPEDQLGELLEAIVSGDRWEGEITINRRHAPPVAVWLTNTPVLDGDTLVGHIGVSVDISARKAADALIAHRATHDMLTDLPNRRALLDVLDADLSTLGADGAPVASLVLIDLGAVDVVSDAFGHDVEERVILRCANNLRMATGPTDQLARYSDHCFAVWSRHATEETLALQTAERLRRALGRPFNLDGIDINLQVSAAVAVADASVADGAELLQRVGTALLQARRDVSSRLYDEGMRAELMRQVELEALVERVISSGTVTLGYQPIVRVDDQRTIGAEALIRLTDDAGRPVSALDVIAVAERTGRIGALGDLILRTACADAVRWNAELGGRSVHVSVNLSARQLEDLTLPERVADALATAGLDPSALWLEVTESALMTDPIHSAALLADLKAQGIKLSADDFGTGYSSLAYLKSFPLDVLKLDRSFVSGLPGNVEDEAITDAIMAIADALGMVVVAEGIETTAQLEALSALGTAYGQGYLWSPALPLGEMIEWLRADEAAAGPEPRPPAPWRVRHPSAGASTEERIDSVLHVVAHELRGPLTAISAHSSLLDDVCSLADARDSGAAIGRAAARIESMLLTMIDPVPGEGAGGATELVVVDAVEMVRMIVADLAVSLSNPLPLVVVPSEALPVRADVTQVEQVLANLVGNAARHAPRASPIEVRLTATDPWVDIAVSDSGPGVEAQHLGLIFRKYGRVDHRSGGTGLGLYVARRIARSHGGDVLYRRRVPQPGSVFTLRLPRADAALGEALIRPGGRPSATRAPRE